LLKKDSKRLALFSGVFFSALIVRFALGEGLVAVAVEDSFFDGVVEALIFLLGSPSPVSSALSKIASTVRLGFESSGRLLDSILGAR
jgi:hypothetical protein